MKKSLLVILSLTCFISFSFAWYRTDKYQAIKEWWEYYNQLQQIYQNEDYISRHSNAKYTCERNSKLANMDMNERCLPMEYTWNLREKWICWYSQEEIDVYCEDIANWMTDEEFKIYGYVENEETVSTRAILDNQCYQSMKWYYDEKEDKCLCEDWNHLENNICVKDEVVTEPENADVNTGDNETSIDTWDNTKITNQDINISENTEEDSIDTSRYLEWEQSEVLSNWFSREFNNAYRFAFNYWITTMDDINKANMNDWLTRIAMAKMLSNYAINVLWKVPNNSIVPKFSDVTEQLNNDYGWAVTFAYQLWIMWIWVEKFRPNDPVTRDEFGTALSRMLYWLADGIDKYYSTHLAKLKEEWIINNDNPDLKELRWYVMLMLMRSAM